MQPARATKRENRNQNPSVTAFRFEQQCALEAAGASRDVILDWLVPSHKGHAATPVGVLGLCNSHLFLGDCCSKGFSQELVMAAPTRRIAGGEGFSSTWLRTYIAALGFRILVSR